MFFSGLYVMFHFDSRFYATIKRFCDYLKFAIFVSPEVENIHNFLLFDINIIYMSTDAG